MLDATNSPETHAIIGALFEVHKELGAGFLEKVYGEALAIEFDLRGIPYVREAPVTIHYKARPLSKPYHMDFVCFGQVILELKCQESIGEVETAQVIHYLKASGRPIGILVNFGEPSLRFKRFVGETFEGNPQKESVPSVQSVAGQA